jgi:hypothetical protein
MSRDTFAPLILAVSPLLVTLCLSFVTLHSNHHPDMTLLRSLSPGCETKESDETYEIGVDVSDGVQGSDMAVELDNETLRWSARLDGSQARDRTETQNCNY